MTIEELFKQEWVNTPPYQAFKGDLDGVIAIRLKHHHFFKAHEEKADQTTLFYSNRVDDNS